MSTIAADFALLDACRVLFGAGVRADPSFLAQLDTDAVRRRFRKRAIEVHPDRAAVLRRPPAVLAEAFKEVEAAYRTLCAHLAAGNRDRARQQAGARPASAPSARSSQPPAAASPAGRTRAPSGHRPEPCKAEGDHRWAGPIPSRTLRLGEFLYYSGRISWLQLIGALVWQAKQRPCFGQVARRFGYLTPERLTALLAYRRTEERIGEAALRLRFITNLQQRVVLQAQQRGCRRIGDYFLETGLLNASDLEQLGRGVHVHNARVAFAGRREDLAG